MNKDFRSGHQLCLPTFPLALPSTRQGRIDAELREMSGGEGLDSSAPLDADALNAIDSMHYLGTEGSRMMMARFPSTDTPSDEPLAVLDLGSGFGGCARFVATKAAPPGAHVTALELQSNISEAAARLTERCGLAGSVTHVTGDILDPAVAMSLPRAGRYDVIFSKLVILHIPFERRKAMWKALAAAAPGGMLYIEDFYDKAGLEASELEALEARVGCPPPPSREAYVRQLEEAGAKGVDFVDVSEPWGDFVHGRSEAYKENLARHTRVHGAEMAENMATFFDCTNRLFGAGRLGGCVIVARFPEATAN